MLNPKMSYELRRLKLTFWGALNVQSKSTFFVILNFPKYLEFEPVPLIFRILYYIGRIGVEDTILLC